MGPFPISGILPPTTSATGATPEASRSPEDLARLRKAAQEFEGLLMNMLLKSMRSTVPESSLFGDSSELKMYEELRDEKLADSMAQSQGLGLARLIERQLGGDPEALDRLTAATQQARDAGNRARFVQEPGLAGPLKAPEED